MRKFLLPLCLLIFGLATISHAQTVNGFDGQNLSWNNNEGVEQVTNVLQPATCVENTGSSVNQACNTATNIPLKPGLSITYITATGNSGALQLNFNNFGSFPIKKWQGAAALVSGDLPANSANIITFTGSYWNLYTIGNIPAGGGGGTPCVTTALSLQYNNSGAFGCEPDLTFTSPHTLGLGASGIFAFTAGATVTGFPCGGLPSLTGDVTTSSCAATVKGINGTLLSGLATGILKNTTTTGIPSIAASADVTVLWGGSCSSSTFLRGDGQCATPSGSGTVTVVGAGSLTSGAIVTGGGAQTLQTPSGSATLNASGNMSLPGTLAVTGHVTFEGITSTGGTGTGALVFGTAPTITLANGTGLPISTGVSGLGAGVATFLATPSSANLAAALTDETGTGAAVFANGPTLIAPVLGTIASGNLAAGTGYVWNNLAAATGNLAIANGSNSSIFTTTTAVNQFFAFKNNTAAVVGTSQASPIISICGTAFHASASVEDCLTFQDTPGNGNDAAITFNIGHSGTSTGVVTTAFAGPVQTGSSSNAGQIQLPGNTANGSLGSNLFNIYGPSSATFTAYGLQYSGTGPAAAGMEAIGTPSGGVSQVTFVTTLPTALVPAFTGDCTNSAGALALTCTKINGTAFPTSATLVGSNSSAQPIAAALPSADIFVGNGSNLPAAVAVSGDITITTAGVVNVAKVNGNTYPANAAFTSGGVACATSTTVLTTSAALTVNVYPKGGGAGACPSNSLSTDTGTTLTYTGTGGILAPIFTANGTTAGFIDFPQGTTSGSVAPCNAANSICWQAPTSVTSYLTNLPGVAPNIASYMQTDGCGSAICTDSFHPVPQLLTVTADFTTAANTNLQTITGLSLTMPVSKAVVASFHCNFNWSQATGTAAVAFGVQGATTAPTNLAANATSYSNTTAETTGTLTALASTTATAVVSVAPSAITTIWKAEMDGTLEAPSNASPTVLNIMVSTATSGDAVTIKRGSYCSVIYQ